MAPGSSAVLIIWQGTPYTSEIEEKDTTASDHSTVISMHARGSVLLDYISYEAVRCLSGNTSADTH